MTDNELLNRQAREKARMDMREDAPHNPYPVNSAQYWAYARTVGEMFNQELNRHKWALGAINDTVNI